MQTVYCSWLPLRNPFYHINIQHIPCTSVVCTVARLFYSILRFIFSLFIYKSFNVLFRNVKRINNNNMIFLLSYCAFRGTLLDVYIFFWKKNSIGSLTVYQNYFLHFVIFLLVKYMLHREDWSVLAFGFDY